MNKYILPPLSFFYSFMNTEGSVQAMMEPPSASLSRHFKIMTHSLDSPALTVKDTPDTDAVYHLFCPREFIEHVNKALTHIQIFHWYQKDTFAHYVMYINETTERPIDVHWPCICWKDNNQFDMFAITHHFDADKTRSQQTIDFDSILYTNNAYVALVNRNYSFRVYGI